MMAIVRADDHDILDWPDHGITMTRAQSEQLGRHGVDLPAGEPRVFAPGDRVPAGVIPVPFSALMQRMEFHHRGRHEPPCMEATE